MISFIIKEKNETIFPSWIRLFEPIKCIRFILRPIKIEVLIMIEVLI